jgi:salicylate biosynthesis isochorismate synthase
VAVASPVSASVFVSVRARKERWVGGMISLAAVDPLAGTELLGEPSIYWDYPPEQEVVAGWGEAGAMEAANASQAQEVLRRLSSARTVRWVGEAPARLPGPWFGGMRFSAERADRGWDAFGFGRWTLPELMVWREGDRLVAAAFVPEGPGAEEEVRALLVGIGSRFPKGPLSSRPRPQVLRVSSSRPAFERSVERATETIARGHFQKVVLARAVDIAGERPFEPVEVLARLREQNPRSATFLFRAPDETVFLGATPETLCRVEGRELRTEALAGTAPAAQAQELRGRDKERREHEAVVRYILEVLRPLAARTRRPSCCPCATWCTCAPASGPCWTRAWGWPSWWRRCTPPRPWAACPAPWRWPSCSSTRGWTGAGMPRPWAGLARAGRTRWWRCARRA